MQTRLITSRQQLINVILKAIKQIAAGHHMNIHLEIRTLNNRLNSDVYLANFLNVLKKSLPKRTNNGSDK